MERYRACKDLWFYEAVVNQCSARTIYSQRTSIMTIAKEKTSASLLYVPSSLRISGAVHRAV